MSQVQITISNEKVDGHTVKIIKFKGNADGSNINEINEVISKIISADNKKFSVVLDGSELDFINSTFIGSMTAWHLKLNKHGSELALASFEPNVLDTIKSVGMLQVLPHFKTINEAEIALTKN